MSLNRRIIVNRQKSTTKTEIILNPLEREREIPPPAVSPSMLPILEPKSSLSLDAMTNADWVQVLTRPPAPRPASTQFSEFFKMIGIESKQDFIYCHRCKTAGEFDADFDNQRIQCLTCGRVVSFKKFKKEQK
jgi:hypothetical protein